MNGGEAAEQVVRLSMEGAEFVLKIAGGAAERIAAMLLAALQPTPGVKARKQTQTKLRGRERLRTMLKSGAELKFFEIDGKDLKEFAAAAKKYGLVYCVLRQKGQEDGMVEIMAKAEDAPKISRILERLEGQVMSENPTPTRQRVTETAAKRTSPTAGGLPAPSSATRSNDEKTISEPRKPSVSKVLRESDAQKRSEVRTKSAPEIGAKSSKSHKKSRQKKGRAR